MINGVRCLFVCVFCAFFHGMLHGETTMGMIVCREGGRPKERRRKKKKPASLKSKCKYLQMTRGRGEETAGKGETIKQLQN